MKFVSHLIHSLERKLSWSLSVENVFGKGWKGREKLLSSMMYLALKNMENVEILCGCDCDRDIGGKPTSAILHIPLSFLAMEKIKIFYTFNLYGNCVGSSSLMYDVLSSSFVWEKIWDWWGYNGGYA